MSAQETPVSDIDGDYGDGKSPDGSTQPDQ